MQTVRISNREIFGGPTDGVMFIALTKMFYYHKDYHVA